MQRVARVRIKVDDAKIQEYATGDEETVEEVVKSLKDDFEGWLKEWKKQLTANVEFIEWEDFCPKCESTDLDDFFRDHPNPGQPGGLMKRCDDCGHEFTEEARSE